MFPSPAIRLLLPTFALDVLRKRLTLTIEQEFFRAIVERLDADESVDDRSI